MDLARRYVRHRRGDERSSYVLASRWATAIYPKYRMREFGLRWLEDEAFFDYYRTYALEPGAEPNYSSADRKYFLRSLLQLVPSVPGDLVECGTYRGATARLIAEMAASADRHLHLFDSFEGLSTPDEQDGDWWTSHDLRAAESTVREVVAGTGASFTTYRGWIPERFPDVAHRRFAFVHIDVDLYLPTRDALDFFYPRLVEGGVILLDDHGFLTCPGATRAAEEWAARTGEVIIDVPTGQGFVVKRRSRSEAEGDPTAG